MVTSNGKPTPPPTEEHLDAALWRIREAVSQQTSTTGTAHDLRRRRWIGAVGGVVLFGAGIAVGGAALPALTNPTPAFSVECFEGAATGGVVATAEFESGTGEAAARRDPVSFCENVRIDTEQESGIDVIVTNLVAQGHQCGVVASGDGRNWSYQEHDGALSLTTGHFDPPLGPDCTTTQVAQVSPPEVQTLGGVACTVSESQVNVYAGDEKDALAICRAQGYSVYSSTTTG